MINMLLEFFLFLGIFFPIYHVINVIPTIKRKRNINKNRIRPISILIPCYNEEKIVKNTIQGLLKIDYYNYECIFINDGSVDNTYKELNDLLQLKKKKRKKKNNLSCKNSKGIYVSKKYSNFWVINKENGGKSDALNIGINYAKYDYVVTLDADSILKKDALSIVSAAFDDDEVIAVSGVIQILQSFKILEDNYKTTLKMKYLLRLQTIEYMKSCFCYKASLAKLNSLLVISGAFGVFKKDILIAVNGFTNVIGEDLDLTLKIQFYIENTNNKILYMPEAICYTEGPDNFRDFIKQRKRWQQSFIESLFNFKVNIVKNYLLKTLPFFLVVDALFIGVVSSFIIVFFSILVVNNILSNTIGSIAIYFIIFLIVHLSYNIIGIYIAYHYNIKYKGMDFIRIIFTIILDILIYRAIILYTIISGTISYFKGNRTWNKVNRSGTNYYDLKRG